MQQLARALLRFIRIRTRVNKTRRLAVIVLSTSCLMLLRDFFYPSLVVACLVFAVAFTGAAICEALALFVYI